MEGFEIINKYNERCLAWRTECSKLLADWAMAGDDKDERFVKETKVIAGFLRSNDNGVWHLLEKTHNARIEDVVLALRYLRAKQQAPSKPSCNFCTRLAEKGEHVEGCLGETPRCDTIVHLDNTGKAVTCCFSKGHQGLHGFAGPH